MDTCSDGGGGGGGARGEISVRIIISVSCLNVRHVYITFFSDLALFLFWGCLYLCIVYMYAIQATAWKCVMY